MNKIKDFFYDKNDILVALIILAIAGFIIYIRIGDIMAYPETLANATVASTEQTTATQASSAATTTAPTGASSAASASTAATTAPATAAPTSIKIADDAISTTVSKQLADAGLVASANEFESALKKYNATSRIRSGTFQIPAGATNEQIIEIITNQKIN